jgi:hypothetical protein
MNITHCQSRSCASTRTSFNRDNWLALEPAGHLFYELTWLLRAAQEWQIQAQLELPVPGYGIQVQSMDAVFMRARLLFEFFLGDGRSYCHAQCLFQLDRQLEYPLYDDGSRDPRLWVNSLHVAALHLQDRTTTSKLFGLDGSEKDLNKMPADIAKGVVLVWEGFEASLLRNGHAVEHNMAKACREQAIRDAGVAVDNVTARAGAYAAKTVPTLAITRLF